MTEFRALRSKLRRIGLSLSLDWEAGRRVWLCAGRSFPSLEAVEKEMKNGRLVDPGSNPAGIHEDAGKDFRTSAAIPGAQDGDGAAPWAEILAVVEAKQGRALCGAEPAGKSGVTQHSRFE